MAEESRTIEANVDSEKFFKVVTDYNSYPEFLKSQGLRWIKVDKSEGNVKLVTQEIEIIGRKIEYTLRMVEDESRTLVTWSLIKGQVMSRNNGSWKIEALGPGHCKAIYTIELKLGTLIPASVTTKLAAGQLPAMLDAFKKRAESLGK